MDLLTICLLAALSGVVLYGLWDSLRIRKPRKERPCRSLLLALIVAFLAVDSADAGCQILGRFRARRQAGLGVFQRGQVTTVSYATAPRAADCATGVCPVPGQAALKMPASPTVKPAASVPAK